MRDVFLLVVAIAAIHWIAGGHAPLGSTTRYTEAAREMVELDDWVVPHLSYAPYAEKPILVYWLGAASEKLFGDSWRARQLPGALATVVTVVATYLIGAAWRGAAFGLASALGMLATSMFLAMASVLSPDPLLTACMAVAWLAAFKVVDATALDGWISRSGRWWSAALWLAIGLGVLTKGPLALIVPAISIAAYAFATGGLLGEWRTLWRLRPLEGLLIVGLVNAPWTWFAWRRDPRLLEFFYVDVNFRSFASGAYNHPGPWHYYFPVAAGMLAPFTLVALPLLGVQVAQSARLAFALRTKRRDESTLDRDERVRLWFACVFALPFLFFSASVSKLGTYLLPLLPAMALLVADAIASWRTSPRWAARATAATAALLLVVVVAAPVVVALARSRLGRDGPFVASLGHLHFHVLAGDFDLARFGGGDLAAMGVGLALTAACLVAAIVTALRRGDARRAMVELALATTLLVVVFEPRATRLLADLDATRLADVVKANAGSDDEVVVHDAAVQHYEFVERLRRPVAIFGKAREVGLGLFLDATAKRRPLAPLPGPDQPIDDPYRVSGENTSHPLLYSNARMKAAWTSGRRVWLLADLDRRDDHSDGEAELRALGLDVVRVDASRDFVLLSNRR